MLNSVQHEILNAHKYKNIKIFSFLGSDKLRMLFSRLINIKIPTIFGILTFISRKKSCSVELNMKKSFITSGPGLILDDVSHCVFAVHPYVLNLTVSS